MLDINKTHNMDCVAGMELLDEQSIDLVVTSPPYDHLRSYDGYSFDYKKTAEALLRVVKVGGVVVWVVNDGTIDGGESGTSFRQALAFIDCGFILHDTMIWEKDTQAFPDKTRYGQCFEYMFVFSKGKPQTFNPICDRINKYAGGVLHGTSRGVDGKTFRKSNDRKGVVGDYGNRFNVWKISSEKNNRSGHPAVFPLQLAKDHIKSWSNEGDLVLDPFMGSGTTGLAALELNRRFIGFEISEKYCKIANERTENWLAQVRF